MLQHRRLPNLPRSRDQHDLEKAIELQKFSLQISFDIQFAPLHFRDNIKFILYYHHFRAHANKKGAVK